MRTESDVNDEMKVMKPEFMKRERKREQRVRARDETDLSGAILNPFCAIKISLFLRNAHQSLSLFLSSLKGFKARERGTRERRARCFGEEDFVANVSLFERSSSNFFSHQIIISLEQKRKHFSLSRERENVSRVVK